MVVLLVCQTQWDQMSFKQADFKRHCGRGLCFCLFLLCFFLAFPFLGSSADIPV